MKDFPIDVSKLSKGDVISRHELSKILGVNLKNREFSYRSVGFGKKLIKQFRVLGRAVTICHKNDDILILTDSEALPYNWKQVKKGRRKMVRAHRRLQEINTGNLTDSERQEHARVVVVSGAMLAGMEAARKEIQPIVHRRKTPGLVAAGV